MYNFADSGIKGGKQMKKRLIALCMAIVLVLGILPVSVMAEGIGKSDYLAAYAKR